MFDLKLNNISRQQFTEPDINELQNISNDIQSYLTTIFNLLTIKQSLETYGKTPQLIDLVGKSFEESNIAFSNEGIVESIGKMFKWIKDKILQFINWIKGLLGFTKKRIKDTKEIINEVAEIAKKNPDTMIEVYDLPTLYKELDKAIIITNKIYDKLHEKSSHVFGTYTPDIMTLDFQRWQEEVNGFNDTMRQIIEDLKNTSSGEPPKEVTAMGVVSDCKKLYKYEEIIYLAVCKFENIVNHYGEQIVGKEKEFLSQIEARSHLTKQASKSVQQISKYDKVNHDELMEHAKEYVKFYTLGFNICTTTLNNNRRIFNTTNAVMEKMTDQLSSKEMDDLHSSM